MYENFRDIVRTSFPRAQVCADYFHVLKPLQMTKISFQNSTRNHTVKYLSVKFCRIFDHKHQEFLDNEPRYNKKLGQYINYQSIMDFSFESFPALNGEFDLKEFYINLNKQATLQTAPVRIVEAISIFENCGIDEYEEFHLLLINWREEIINSFNFIEDKRINNSFIESKNRLVAKLIYNANGLKTFKRTRNRILLYYLILSSFRYENGQEIDQLTANPLLTINLYNA